eukprot:GHVU01073140.1.p2 GENE.GHVU01073140.1~~GHVU01073140.1.p2  ORF type:complete len:115 (-),score=20.16 GHVU01073140.1:1306-1650(-)
MRRARGREAYLLDSWFRLIDPEWNRIAEWAAPTLCLYLPTLLPASSYVPSTNDGWRVGCDRISTVVVEQWGPEEEEEEEEEEERTIRVVGAPQTVSRIRLLAAVSITMMMRVRV